MLKQIKKNLTASYDDNGQLEEAWSYDTCLLIRTSDTYVLNCSRYSNTTTKHQNILKQLVGECSDRCIIVSDIPTGATKKELLAVFLKTMGRTLES